MSYAQFLEARAVADRHWRTYQKLRSEAYYEPTPTNRAAAERELQRYRRAVEKVKQIRAAWLAGRRPRTDGGSVV